MENNSDLLEKQKADKYAYRGYGELTKNLIEGHIFPEE